MFIHSSMNDHLKKDVAKCDTCRSVDTKQQKETLRPHEITTKPRAKVGTDLFTFDNKEDLLTITAISGKWTTNRKAESTVKTAKRLMKKEKVARQDPFLDILGHRNTPTQGLDTSPAQRLLSRKVSTLLPIRHSQR